MSIPHPLPAVSDLPAPSIPVLKHLRSPFINCLKAANQYELAKGDAYSTPTANITKTNPISADLLKCPKFMKVES